MLFSVPAFHEFWLFAVAAATPGGFSFAPSTLWGGDPFILRGGFSYSLSSHLRGAGKPCWRGQWGFLGTFSCNFWRFMRGCANGEGDGLRAICNAAFPARPRGWPRPSPVLRMGGGGGLDILLRYRKEELGHSISPCRGDSTSPGPNR